MPLPDQSPDDPLAGLTAAARRVVGYASLEAAAFGKTEVSPEHLLLGLSRESDGYAARVLAQMGIDHDKMVAVLARITGITPKAIDTDSLAGEVKLSLTARRTLVKARSEAVRLNHSYIGTEHLLLAIVDDPVGLSAGVIEELDASLDKITVAIEELIRLGSDGKGTFEQVPAVVGATSVAVPAGAVVATESFADVEGCDEAKIELQETIDFLKFPERFTKLGARIPRGVMLYGPPGTGKTLLARATSHEAGVPFYPVAGSDFVELYVGQGDKHVRDLFKKVKRGGVGIIFIDEIDALARARSSDGGGSGGDREADQTLNALLVEMDGFGTADNIIVMAATNRLDILDPAVLRPGRFTRHIEVPLPDLKARLKILGVHARNKPLGKDVNLEALAKRCGGFSGAELANVLNEAAILAARRDGDCLTNADLEDGWLKTRMGTSTRRSKDPRPRALVAAHEIGHALANYFADSPISVEEISLFSQGEMLGFNLFSENDNALETAPEVHGLIVGAMGGRAGEWVAFGETTPGVSNDMEKANFWAASLVRLYTLGASSVDEYGLGKDDSIGLLVKDNIAGPLAEAAMAAQRRILAEDYRRAVDILREHAELFEKLCAHIFDEERIGRDEFAAIVEGKRDPSPEALAAWRAIAADVRTRPGAAGAKPD